MKRKPLFLFALIVALLSLTNVHVSAEPVLVNLEVGFVDPTENQDEPQRNPVIAPSVEYEDGVLTFITSCDYMELRLVNEENEVEYSTYILGSTLVLPSYLNGDYQLQIISGNYIFYGNITL